MSGTWSRIGRRTCEEFHSFLRLSRGIGLAPSALPRVRFLIVAFPRTGSTMLRALIESHPNIACFYELYHRSQGQIPFDRLGWKRAARDPELLRLRREDPRAFLNRTVYGPHSPSIHAAGWKLIHGQLDDWKALDLTGAIRAFEDLKVLHVRRENALESLVSLAEAQESGHWGTGATGGERQGPMPPLTLDIERVENRFEHVERGDLETRRRWADFPMLEVVYEKLAANPEGVGKEVLEFLEVENRPLAIRTRKTGAKSLSDRISNYAELKQHFRGTKWERYFVD